MEDALDFTARLRLASTSTIFRGFALRSHVSYLRTVIYRLGVNNPQGLLKMLSQCNGVVTGSTALSVILKPYDWSPNDLNLVVPRDGGTELETFLLRDGFIRLPTDGPCATKSQLIDFVTRHCTYARWNQSRACVTITESVDESVLPVILAGSSTADMVCANVGGVFAAHPLLLTAQISIRGYPSSPISDDVAERFHARQFIVLDDTADLPGECHALCPLLWRSVERGHATMSINWSLPGRRQNDNEFPHITPHRYWWRLHNQCRNEKCTFRRHDIAVTKTAPMSADQILTVRQDIANHPVSHEQSLVGDLRTLQYRC